MRRSTIRTFAAALFLVPTIATCTQPSGIVASAHEHVSAASEDRLVSFLIDGEASQKRPTSG